MRASSVGLLTLLSLVFAVSVTGKLRDQRSFADSLRTLLPERWVGAVATSVTAAEALLAVGLGWVLVGQFGPGSGWPGWLPPAAAVAFLAVLTVGVASAIRRGTGTRCACFGSSTRLLSGRHLVRNGVLLGAATVALALSVGSPGPPVEPAAGLVGAAAGVVLAVVVVRLDDLIDLFQPVRS